MSKTWMVLMIIVITLSACLPGQNSTPVRPSTGRSCGDGTCTSPENTSNCPADCPSTPGNPDTGKETPTSSVSHDREAPLYMTTMTHMEGNFTDDQNQSVFNMHIQQLTYGMDMADEYGALLTIESEKPFAIANDKWGRNFMQEIVERSHGVGTHCDFGFRSEVMPVADYAAYFSENKAKVDKLVGDENNLGCSGGGGANDWAQAAAMAGFKYLDGVVGMYYLSMPMENRPDASWTNDYIFQSGYHEGAPVDLYERIYPFMVKDASDFEPDPDGVTLISSGELGALSMMAEGKRDLEYPLTNSDVDTLVTLIQQIDQNRDRTRIAKLTVYLPANIYGPENEQVLRYFFGQMQSLDTQGVITWATQKQVYEAYVDWNN